MSPISIITKRLRSLRNIIGKEYMQTPWGQILRGVGGSGGSGGSDLTWTTKTPLNTPRWGLSAFNILQKIWLVGGDYDDGYLADIEVYDPGTDTWTVIPYPFSIFGGQAFVAASNGMIYGIGGLQSCWTLATPVEEYNPITGQLTPKADLPVACLDPGIAAAPDGKIYVMGGCLPPTVTDPDSVGPPDAYLNTLQVYDTQTNSWALKKDMPTARAQLCAVMGTDGNIYAIGGFETWSHQFNNVEMYNPTTDTWEPRAPMPTRRSCFAAVHADNGKIYAIGGLDGDRSLTNVEEFDYNMNTWTSKNPLSMGRWYLGAAALGNRLYAIGGKMRVGSYLPGNSNVTDLSVVEEGTLA